MATRVDWREGDIVFRKGTGVAGHAIVAASSDGVYSHIGLIVFQDGQPMVVHAVPGEPDFEGDPDRVKLDAVPSFFSPECASHGAVMRLADSICATRAAGIALAVYRRNTLFDHDYDDSDTTRMYCSELIGYAYERAGHPFHPQRRYVGLPGISREVVFPSAIAACPELSLIYKF